jgi:hypothetical protein
MDHHLAEPAWGREGGREGGREEKRGEDVVDQR